MKTVIEILDQLYTYTCKIKFNRWSMKRFLQQTNLVDCCEFKLEEQQTYGKKNISMK